MTAKVNVNPKEHARRRLLGKQLSKEPMRKLTAKDLADWQPDISNRRNPGEREGDEWRFRHHFVPHNEAYIRAYCMQQFEDMARGEKRAASLRTMDIARKVPIHDKDGRLVTVGVAASNNWGPMLARLLRRLYPEFPVGYTHEFPYDETPYLTLVRPSKGRKDGRSSEFSDWLEGK